MSSFPLRRPPLRVAIAKHYDRVYGLAVDPSQVVVTVGASGAFVLTFLAAFDPGDRVVVPEPAFPAYKNTLRALGVEVVRVGLGPDCDFKPTVAQLEALPGSIHLYRRNRATLLETLPPAGPDRCAPIDGAFYLCIAPSEKRARACHTWAARQKLPGEMHMKVVFALFDSVNRKALAPYGGQVVATPNFSRLAERAVTFDGHHVGSLPCMPARRDLMTGRLSFLHRSWGPLEPFDNAFPELLAKAGVYSHLISDHCHYWRDGGATYHTRYDTFEFIRGQEKDPWKAMVQPPWERLREKYHPMQFSDRRRDKVAQNIINREMSGQDDDAFPSVQCFNAALEFLETNREADDWFLQIETFDPHEPFQAPARFRDAYPTNYAGPVLDWPPYARVSENPDECAELRANYNAVLALCDAQLGRLLDDFDTHNLWSDTALIVSTDHGFLLGEHDWWAKNRMHCYEEVSHIPLFVHHPGFQAMGGQRRQTLSQTTDLMATFMDCFGVALPAETQGVSLLPVLAKDQELRQAVLFGYFGGAVNLADGRYTYFRYPADLASQEVYQYTMMPTHLNTPFSPEELAAATLAPAFGFTKGVPVLKVPVVETSPMYRNYGPGALLDKDTVLFDLEVDPGQLHPVRNSALEARLEQLMAQLMAANEAPPEAFLRLGIEPRVTVPAGA